MIERTLVVIKPDGVFRGLNGKIIAVFEEAGLKIVGAKMVHATKEMLEQHYVDDEEWKVALGTKTVQGYKEKGLPIKETPIEIGNKIRNLLMSALARGPVFAMVLEGNDAIAQVRKITGATAPTKADPSTIRGRFTTDSYDFADAQKRIVNNLIHASEDKKTADREIRIWFKKNEIYDYKRCDESALFG